jgi:hypothetical protein
MPRKILAVAVAATVLAALCPSFAAGQSKAAKISNALAAAPASVAKGATVMDWPDKSGKSAQLRAGTNGWVCMPSEPKSKYINNDAMCLDPNFMSMIGSMMAKQPPAMKGVGYAYMLTTDDWESNTAFGEKGPTPTNGWHHVGSHVMVAYPDKAALAGLPTTPSKDGPYVMWPTTPYAHVMWPVK